MTITKHLIIATLFALPALASARGFMASADNEIQIGSAGNGGITSEKSGGSSITTISLRGSYARQMRNDHLQVGGEGGLTSASGGVKSESAFQIVGFGTWNFNTDIRESFYGKGGVGLFPIRNDKAELESKFGLFVGGGKRVPLLNGAITWNPEARLYKKGDLDPSFEVMIFNVSVLW